MTLWTSYPAMSGCSGRGAPISGSVRFTMRSPRPFPSARTKQMYYCFGCGAGGNVFTFLMEYENFTVSGGGQGAGVTGAGVELPESGVFRGGEGEGVT